jgi:PAS domain S-box-containing protein
VSGARAHGDALARARRAEDELERFFELSDDLLCIASFDGFFTRVNPAFEQTLGYSAEELLREPFLGLVHPDDLESTAAELGSLGRGGRTISFENRFRRRDGSYRWLQWTGIGDREHSVVYAVARDVTEAKEAEIELRTLLAGQTALRRVATLVARERGHAEVFELVTEEVARLLGARSASIVRYDGGVGLVIGGWSQAGAARLPPGTEVELETDTAAGGVYRTGEAVRIDGFDDERGGLARALRELGFRSALGAPIRVGGELWGALIVSRDSDEPWPGGVERRLADFAELVAQAVANADVRDQLAASRARVVEASDAERRRLERNLHDGAQQRLVTLALNLRLAETRIAKAPDEAQRLLAAAREELSLALGELRELATGLHPAILSERGLGSALEALAGRVPVTVDVVEVPAERLPESVEVAAYYLVSEALTNVVKYADATVATVAITRAGGGVVVEVSDDGVGGADVSGGSGLRGLADRIGALSGALAVESPPGGGTRIRAEIPFGRARAEPSGR